MKALARRLCRPEDSMRPMVAAMNKSEVPEISPVERIRQQLDDWGIVREPNESLAEATARALGWTCPQLRAYLESRAAGGG